jgi:hypothetical protein
LKKTYESSEIMADRPVFEITPDMVSAGMNVLATWKQEDDFVSEKQAVIDIFRAMVRISQSNASSKGQL